MHGGRIVKTTGDGLLLEFASVVAAVECVVAVQEGMAVRNADIDDDEAIRFRIGVHLRDVIVEGDDIFGDDLNIAARLQEISEAEGGAISGDAHNSVGGRIDAEFADDGDQELKNIARPVRVWRWPPDQQTPAETVVAGPDEPLPLPDKPSIAVLPFDNMSGDPEQEFFADGIAEDVITTLSKIPALLVIARNSSFHYKGKSRDVGRELGVRYVVEGSVRKAGNRVRVTAQLVDCSDGQHVWADRFDGDLVDVFDLQDRISKEIVIALEVKLTEGEEVRIWRKRSGNPKAYEHLARARKLFFEFSGMPTSELSPKQNWQSRSIPHFGMPGSYCAMPTTWRPGLAGTIILGVRWRSVKTVPPGSSRRNPRYLTHTALPAVSHWPKEIMTGLSRPDVVALNWVPTTPTACTHLR
jgi:TolB-like protein